MPDAHVKVYLTASLNVRAIRRYKEYKKMGIKTTLGRVKSDIKKILSFYQLEEAFEKVKDRWID